MAVWGVDDASFAGALTVGWQEFDSAQAGGLRLASCTKFNAD